MQGQSPLVLTDTTLHIAVFAHRPFNKTHAMTLLTNAVWIHSLKMSRLNIDINIMPANNY